MDRDQATLLDVVRIARLGGTFTAGARREDLDSNPQLRVDLDVVWDVASTHAPDLLARLEPLIPPEPGPDRAPGSLNPPESTHEA